MEKKRVFLVILRRSLDISEAILFVMLKRIFVMRVFLCVKNRNLSNLNLGGEISPAIGELKNLQFV